MFMDVCLVKPWMMKGVRRVIQSTVLKEIKEDYRNGWGNNSIFYIKRKKVNQINTINIQYIHLSEKYLISEQNNRLFFFNSIR